MFQSPSLVVIRGLLCQIRSAGLLGLGLLFFCAGAAAGSKNIPQWDVPPGLSTDDGSFQLDWHPPADDPGGNSANGSDTNKDIFYKITERFAGNKDAEIEPGESTYFVDGTRLLASRVVAGEYRFTLQACKKNKKNLPVCGKSPEDVTLTVTAAVIESLISKPLPPTVGARVVAPAGGPSEMRPGDWYNPEKSGHGWAFFWSNRLAFPESSSLYGNAYDLVGVWYTYEAKHATAVSNCSWCPPTPSIYRPVALRLKAVKTASNTFSGTLVKTRSNGTSVSVGSANIIFGTDRTRATVQWSVNFKKESLADTDAIEFLHGPDPASTNSISHMSGVWERATDKRYYVVSDLGSSAEVDAVIFHDSAGDPTWIQAVNNKTPTSNTNLLCFGYINEGYSPAQNKPSNWALSWHNSGCNNALAAASNNRNGRRYFSSATSQSLWTSFTLPGVDYATGSVNIGSYSYPVVLQKLANFQGVKYDHAGGSSCDLTTSSGKCRVKLTWFSDSYYPSATVFAKNKTSGAYTKVHTSSQSATVDFVYDVVTAGVYRFELRMGSTTGSTLMASSSNFTVTTSVPSPLGSNPETPPAPAGSPSLSANSGSSRVGAIAGQFRVDETGSAAYTIPILTAPASGGLQPQIALSYSSLAGNGTVGVGWSLSGLSAISRCPQTIEQDGIAGSRALRINSSDRFCLDGQRLILVPGSGSYGANGAQYRTEIDGFSRVTSYGSSSSGPTWFKVEHKDGSVGSYGKTTDSRIKARGAANSSAYLVWAQNRFEDRYSNYMTFTYQQNSSGPVAYVISQINYSGNTRAGTAPSARLIFTHANRSTNADLSYTYLGGVQVEQRKLLTSIRSQGKIHASSSYQDLRFYALSYQIDGSGRQIMTSLRECSSASQAICYPATTFGWLKSEHQINASGSTLSGLLPKSRVRGLVLADVSGDGRPDLLYTEKVNSNMYLRVQQARSNGTFSLWGSRYALTRREDGQAPPVIVMDVDGDGLQDVIYSKYNSSSKNYSWVALLSTGTSLTAERSLRSSFRYFLNDEDLAPIAQALDFNGDGLSDILFTHTNEDGTTSQMSVMLNQSIASSNIGFSAPVNLNTDNADLFVIGNGSDFEMRHRPPYYTSNNTAGSDHDVPRAQVFDFDGDGTVDLLLNVSREFERCVENCGLYQGVGLASGPGISPVLEVETASFWVVMTSNGSNAYSRYAILALGDDCDMALICDKAAYQSLPKAKTMTAVDINIDGLADLVWRAPGDYWYFKYNTGRSFTAAQFIARAPYDVGDHARFEDFNGDGYADLIYPSAKLNANATWMVHENHFGRTFAAASNSGVKSGNVGGRFLVDKVENDSSIFADFTGDGKLDQLLIDSDDLGQILASRFYKGRNRLGGGAVEPSNVITRITDGFGATHEVTYLPMTDGKVYSRMHDSGAARWGRGSVVYDLILPVYLVSQASISAPVNLVPSANSSILYHYVGAKMQAGGRGFLGFGEVISYDKQSRIRTNTRFRQDFPYIGVPVEKMEAAGASSYWLRSLSNLSANTPPVWGGIYASTAASSSPGGVRISHSINEWGSKLTSSHGAYFPYIVDKLERHYMLNGGFSSKSFITNGYDSLGNLLHSVSGTFASDSGAAIASQTTVNTYYTARLSSWDFARLKTSDVTRSRGGTPAITRKTLFEYDSTTAAVRREIKEPGDSRLEVVTTFTRDLFGNKLTSAVAGRGVSSRVARVYYDPIGRFAIQSKNALEQVTQLVSSWDRFGNTLALLNMNGVETRNGIDFMGRPFANYTETGVWSRTYRYWGKGSICPNYTVYQEQTTGGGQPTLVKCYDKLQREVRTAKSTLSGKFSYVDQSYDSSGRIIAVSEPYFSGSNIHWSHTQYDPLGRVVAILSAAGDDVLRGYDYLATSTCTSAGAHHVRITNGLGRSQIQVKNALDEAVAVYDVNCGKLSYLYDAQGNLRRITGADGAVTTMTYDLAGRKTSMVDPDKGTWRYAYNALGEMTRQMDSKGQATDFTYDKLGRMTSRFERTGVTSLTDSSYTTLNSETTIYITSGRGKGQPGSITYRNAAGGLLQRKSFTYDIFSRPIITTTAIGRSNFVEETTYDRYSRPFQQFDASGDDHGLRYTYLNGYLSSIKEAREGVSGKVYQRVLAMDARGNISQMELGNGVDVFADYEAKSGRLLGLSAYSAQGAEIQNVDYLFDVLGNLKRRLDYSGSTNMREYYAYDSLDRLRIVKLSANNSALATTLDTRYDASGNITYKSDVGSFYYQGPQPHAVTRAGGVSYRYDANGNQISGDGRTISYTVFDKPKTITKGGNKVAFAYGIGNARYQRKDYAGRSLQKTTLYLGSVERITKGSSTQFKRYLAGVAIADYFPSTGAQSISYLLKDHIGSIHTVLNEAGQISATMHFSAFGDRHASNWKTPLTSFLYAPLNNITTKGFTGHEQVDDMGMIHMNGRTYDPRLGRFLQADALVQEAKFSQSLNRYSYVMNNPLSFTDPSGNFNFGRFLKTWGRVIGIAVISYYTFGASSGWSAAVLAETSLTPAMAGTLSAMIGGATAGFVGGSLATGTFKGAISGALIGAFIGGVANGANPYGKDAGDAIIRGALSNIATDNKYVSAITYLYVGAEGSLKTIANVFASGRNFSKAVLNYGFSKQVENFANKHHLELWEFNLALTINSFVGREFAGTTLSRSDSGMIVIAGFFNRNKHRWLGAIWDVNDTVLGYQGLLDAIGYEFAAKYRGQSIKIGHSLGALRASNLVASGYAQSAEVYSLPFGNIAPSNVGVTLGKSDWINGGVLGGLLNSGARMVPCGDSSFSGSFCHKFEPNYARYAR